MDALGNVLVKAGKDHLERKDLLALLAEEDAQQASSSAIERSFAAPNRGLRRALLLLAIFVLSFVGANYALLVRNGVAPKQVAGVAFMGTCEPSGEIRISAEGLGTVSEMLVVPGDRVEQGQVLLKMDDSEAQAALKQAELDRSIALQNLSPARLRYAETKEKLSVSQTETQQLPARQWRDSPERATAAYEHARTNYDRSEALFEAGVLSKQELDDKAVDLRLAKDDLTNAQKLADASQHLEVNQREHAIAESALSREENLQAFQQADLRFHACARRVAATEVRAPRSGVVAEVSAHVGDRLSGGVLLVRLAQLHTMIVEVPVAADLISQLHVRQAALIQLPTLPVRTVDGIIRAINPLPSSNMTHNVQVEFTNDDLSLFSGQPAKVRFLNQ
jgi:multidrug resistance efflux pump